MERTFELKPFGTQLWTRPRARKVRDHVNQLLEQLQPGDVLIIDLNGVEVFDTSFASEFFGKTQLSLSVDYPDRFLVIDHLTEYTEENLADALTKLNLIMVARADGTLRLIGQVHPADAETFGAIQQAGSAVTSTELAQQLGLRLTAVNERLAKLANLGILRRSDGVSPAGRLQYLYNLPTR